MAEPLVSVIVLTYNQADTVGRTLDSILAQRCQFGIEIVIGDDASSDSTRAVCLDYARRYPEVVRLMPEAPNKGVVRNYFDCLAACRGRYIADCSGDDRWCDDCRLQRQADVLEADPSVSAVSGDWTVGGVLHPASDSPTALDFLCASGELPMQLSASLYRADVVRRELQRPGQTVCRPDFGCEDLPVSLALLRGGRIRRLPGATLVYTVAEGSVSRPRSARSAWNYYRRVLHARLTLASFYGICLSAIAPAMRRRLDHLATLAFRIGDPALAADLVGLAASDVSLRPGARGRLLMAIMKRRTLWGAARRLLIR